MRKFLTTGFLGAILGLLVGAPADASLISRSFLDQALTDYATNTALDLKANQSDFTDLNTQISDSVDLLRELLVRGTNSYELVKSIDPEKYPNTISGAFSLLYQYLENFANSISWGWTDSGGNIVFGLRDITEDYYNGTRADVRKLFDGWDAGNNTSYLGVIGLNDKIGTLPEGITVQGMYEGWTLKDRSFHGLSVISDYASMVEDAYRVRFPFLFTQGSQSTTIDGVDYTGPVYPLWKLSEGIDKIGNLPNGRISSFTVGEQNAEIMDFLRTKSLTVEYPRTLGQFMDEMYTSYLHTMFAGWTDTTGKEYGGLIDLNNQIGTLPSGNMDGLRITSKAFLFGSEIGSETTMLLPSSLEELIKMLFVYDETPPAFEQIISGYFPNSETPSIMGLYPLTTRLLKLTKDIGTLPSGTLLDAGGGSANLVYQRAQNGAPVYPTSLEEFVLQIYGEVGKTGGLVSSLLYDINSAKSSAISADSKATTAQTTADTAKAAADANTAKIGDLPTEYATVGAALTAIKGIAEDAKAAALAAIPDPKTEGSTGKFVLTVDIVGDNATYRWEKIDREGETTTTTE